MNELPGKIRVQDATLANMVSIAAILEYLEMNDPGSKDLIQRRAHEIALAIREQSDLHREENEE